MVSSIGAGCNGGYGNYFRIGIFEHFFKHAEKNLETSSESVVNQAQAWMNKTITALEMQRDTLQYYKMDAKMAAGCNTPPLL